jgi:hypothetical protein
LHRQLDADTTNRPYNLAKLFDMKTVGAGGISAWDLAVSRFNNIKKIPAVFVIIAVCN